MPAVVKLLLIATFGALGSVLRYLLGGWFQRLSEGAFPIGTLLVNVVGCLGIGLSGAFFFGPRLIREEYRLAIMVGLLGGFTTFSSFAWESFRLLEGREFALACAYALLSNAVGLFAVWVAYRVGIRIFGA